MGGGVGVHSMAACTKFPKLHAIILERNEVINLGESYVKQSKLTDRIQFHNCDFFKDNLSEGDVYFLSDILHDWNSEKCLFLLKKIFKKLSNNGILIIHEIFFNNNKTGPWSAASYNISMRTYSEGRQYAKREIVELLTSIGYQNIDHKSTFADWGIIVAAKI
ncbi:hypothetical protein EF513_07455 [Rickettsiales endosymbiont of Stachyamoeba lipophora]|nr:hypothetical protein EF513_07455 [Rickettsiales endosymbiont of Stachyamoeba lipophora]